MSEQGFNPNAAAGSDSINKAAQTAHQTIDKAAAAADAARESTTKAYANFEQSLRECTKDHPIQSLLWAVGIGFVLGRLIR